MTGVDGVDIGINIGNDNSNFWSTTSTSIRADGTALLSGWNLMSFDWDEMTGTPDMSSVSYLRIVCQVGLVSQVGMKVCNLTSNIGKYLEMVYYSKYLFSNGGVWQETITDTDSTDLTAVVNLDTESYGLYFNLLCYYICQQLMGANAQKDAQFFLKEYQRSLSRYTAMYKSETLLPSEPWYRLPSNRINIGPRWFG